MQRIRIIVCTLLLSAVGIGFYSCRKEKRTPSWDVDMLLPLVKSKMGIGELVTDSLLYSNPDNSLQLVYQHSISTFSLDSLFLIPDTTIKNTYPSPFTYPANPGGIILPQFTNTIYYPLGDAQITKVILRNGKMKVNISSQIKGMVDFTYTLPKVKDVFGNVFDTTVTVSAATVTTDGTFSGEFDLSGYHIDLTGPTGIVVNTMITSYSAVLSPLNSGSITVTAGELVELEQTFVGIEPAYAKGYFGHVVSGIGPDSADFPMFSHFTSGTLGVEDVNISLNIENSIGADARITINQFSSVNTPKNSVVALSSPVIGAPLNISRSFDNGGNVVPSTYSISLTSSNSNIKPFIENMPDKLAFQLGLEVNPLGNVSGNNDFVYYDKLMKTELNISMPLSLMANELALGDTLDVDISGGLKNVNSGTFYLYADNGFPFTARAQIYLLDADGNVADSLISPPNSIAAPYLDGNNICAGKKLSVLGFPVDEAKLSLLRETKKMYLKVVFNTLNQPDYMKIYSFYEMDVKLVADVNYTIGKK